MLFSSVVADLFQKLNLEIDTAANQARKTEVAKRLRFYHGEQLTDLDALLSSLFSEPDKLTKVVLNITRKVIDNLAQVYTESPLRTVEGSEKDQQLYEEMIEQASLDIKMKQCSRYTKLLKTVLVRVLWRNERLDLDILTGNILDVEVEDTPEDLKRVLVTDYGNSDKVEDVEYSLWDAETWYRLDYRGNIIDQKENPYGVLPFLPVCDYPPDSSFWLSGSEDLISQQECINLALVDLKYLLSTQSFGVGWIRGSLGGGTLRVDPGTLVELAENGAIGFEAQKARIEEVVGAIDKLVKWACVSHGLSAASMSTDPSEASGLSKVVDTRELAELRRDDVCLFRKYEKQLFNLMRVIWNAHNAKKLSESAVLRIDFADVQPVSDPKTQAQAWDTLMALGVLSPVDIALERNPDLGSRENALAHLLKVKDENRELSE